MPHKKKSAKPPTKPESDRLKPISLYPMTPDDALRSVMSVDPEKVDERLRQKGIKKPK